MPKYLILLLVCQFLGNCRTIASTPHTTASGAISGAGDFDPFLEFMCRAKLDGERIAHLQRHIPVKDGSVLFSLDHLTSEPEDGRSPESESFTPTVEIVEISRPNANPIISTTYTGPGGFKLVVRSREEHIDGQVLIDEWPFADDDLHSLPRFKDYLNGALIYRGTLFFEKFKIQSVPLLCWYYPFARWIDFEEFSQLVLGPDS